MEAEVEMVYDLGDELDRKLSSSSRMGFIRKVYGILFTQLFFTAIWLTIVSLNRSFFLVFLKARIELLILSIVGFITTLYTLGCYKDVARRVPLNYSLLALFTMCFSYLASFTTVQYDPQLVLASGLLTAGMTLGLTLYAIMTKEDFSGCLAFLWALVLSFLVSCLLAIFISNKILQILLCFLVISILSIYIIYDTQLIVGQRSAELLIDDYVFAAMMLYIDIMRLFLEVLKLLGKKN